MNFREEYIRAVEEITPDRQTIDRMKANVLNMTRTKRAFPFKTVAAVGGTAAACAVITLAAVRIAPNLSNNFDNLIMPIVSMADSSTAAGINGMAEDKAAEFTEECTPEEACELFSCDMWDEEPAIDDDVYGNKNLTAPAAPSATQDNDGSGIGAEPCAVPSPDAVSADELEAAPAENSDAVSPDAPASHDAGSSDVPASHDAAQSDAPASHAAAQSDAPAKDIYEEIMTAEPNDMPENEWAETLDNALEGTLENGHPATGGPVPFIGYTLTIAEDWSECTLSNNEERLTFKRSSRTDTSSFANDMSILYIPLTNTTDNKTYLIALADDTVILKNENNEIVGLFI